ncbi:energy transducer TonB family protein [Sphingomonas sp. PB4P5]|uniref:energy transducer TonB family protein n=1 Tax=Parasphingomonas puruogangriensis TaxID=3096155 RepID=UPI002FCA8BF5
MAAATLGDPAMLGGPGPRRRKRSPVTFGRIVVVLGIVLALALAYMLAGRVTVSERPNEMKTTTVILPPPPPPPPPEPKPQEKPPEPKPMPLDQPVVDTPPPPTPDAQPVAGDSALTAREGAGPSNYGLAVGNGGGTRIGGKVGGGTGGNGFGAYANIAVTDIRRAAQSDAALSRGRYSVRLLVTVDADGRITGVRLIDGSGDTRRDAAIERRLTGLQLSQRPPQGLPAMRIQLNTRSGA